MEKGFLKIKMKNCLFLEIPHFQCFKTKNFIMACNQLLEYRTIIKYCSLRGLTVPQIYKEMTTVYGENFMNILFVYKWVKRFNEGNLSIKDLPRSGQHSNQFLPEEIQNFLQDYPHESLRSMADFFNVSHETVRQILVNKLNFKKFSHRWIPHSLSIYNKQQRVEKSQQLLQIIENSNNWPNIYTTDESWFYYSNYYDKSWKLTKNEVPQNVSTKISSKKVMVVIIWNIDGFHLGNSVQKGETYNSDYASKILKMFDNKLGMPIYGLEGKMLHWDNARPHKSSQTQKVISKVGLKELPHPPYSPDIAPSDFFLFGYLKSRLKGFCFDTEELLMNKILLELGQIEKQLLVKVFQTWVERLKTVISTGGEYIVK